MKWLPVETATLIVLNFQKTGEASQQLTGTSSSELFEILFRLFSLGAG
jgi:tRNA(His) 5'-end guanylyltransferase